MTNAKFDETGCATVKEADPVLLDTEPEICVAAAAATTAVDHHGVAADERDASERTDAADSIGLRSRPRVVAYGLLPAVALVLTIAAAFLKWQDTSVSHARVAGAEAVQAAIDGTIALLSYKPETVEADLEAARSRMTGTFLDSYNELTHDVVIPGAKQKQISAQASVPAAGSVSVVGGHAVALLFVNQAVTVGNDPVTNTGSSVRVSLDRVDGRWLISGFDPV